MSTQDHVFARGLTALTGRTAVVTGAASGIGLALVREFLASGMNVVMADVESTRLTAAHDALGFPVSRVIAVTTDVSDEQQVARLAERAVDVFSEVHVLCNNAGVETGGWIDEVGTSGWRWVLDVNLWGAVHGCRTFLPLLRAAGEGHIVMTGSVSSVNAREPLTFAPYAVSKFGVLALAEALDAECVARRDNIGVSILAPGPVRTDMVRAERNRPNDVPSSLQRELRADILGAIEELTSRVGMPPAEVASLVRDAIVEHRFFILTHPDSAIDAVEDRLHRMRDGVAPIPRESRP